MAEILNTSFYFYVSAFSYGKTIKWVSAVAGSTANNDDYDNNTSNINNNL